MTTKNKLSVPRKKEANWFEMNASNFGIFDRNLLREFYKEVCHRAEANMLKTGKLEGSHYAAMKKLLEELKVL